MLIQPVYYYCFYVYIISFTLQKRIAMESAVINNNMAMVKELLKLGVEVSLNYY